MNIKLKDILRHPTFKGAQILAGKNGLNRTVNRVSVFDCALADDLQEQNIIDEGDFFLSGLQQFKGDKKNLIKFIELLITLKSSGLCVMSNHYDDILTEDILKLCDENRFPVIHVDEDIPYAYVMDTIYKFLSIESLNAINELKLDQILNARLSEQEKSDLIHSMNSSIEDYIQVIYIKGTPKSIMFADEIDIEYLNDQNNIFVNSKRKKVFIGSGKDPDKLANRISAIKSKLGDYFENPILGISRIYNLTMIDKALDEASLALEVANTLGVSEKEYTPLSTSQLLIPIKNSKELEDFYEAAISTLSSISSADGLDEMLNTIKVYVLNKGDYKKTAKYLNQHENTIRYRVNKAREAFDMKDDIIAFHEILSVITKTSLLLKARKL